MSERGRATSARAFGETRPGFGAFFFSILGRRVSDQRVDELPCDRRQLFDRRVEGGLVCGRGLSGAADFAYVLQRGVVNLVVGGGRIEVEERSDIAAHAWMVIQRASAQLDHG